MVRFTRVPHDPARGVLCALGRLAHHSGRCRTSRQTHRLSSRTHLLGGHPGPHAPGKNSGLQAPPRGKGCSRCSAVAVILGLAFLKCEWQ